VSVAEQEKISRVLPDPRKAARVGQAPRQASKTFQHAFADLDPEVARAAGLNPGEVGEVEYKFVWKPWGWGAGSTWAEEAVRKYPKAPQKGVYLIGLSKIIQSSNFGLEEGNYDDIHPDVMEWVLLEVGLKARAADPKKSSGSSEEDTSEEPTTTP